MKTEFRNIAAVLGLTAMLGAANLIADSWTRSRAEIPFDFQVNSKVTLPAGQYEIRYLRDTKALVFTNQGNGRSATVIAYQFESGVKQDAKLTFQFDGEKYALRAVWFAGVDGAFGPPRLRGPAEKERGVLATVRMANK